MLVSVSGYSLPCTVSLNPSNRRCISSAYSSLPAHSAPTPKNSHLSVRQYRLCPRSSVGFRTPWLNLTIPKALEFVKFRLAPVKTRFQPWHFVSPAIPPEAEVKVKRWYDPSFRCGLQSLTRATQSMGSCKYLIRISELATRGLKETKTMHTR